MNDRTDAAISQPFDDDRLLAYALGLDDDADLLRALADNAGLRARLDAIAGDLDAIASGLHAAVPPEAPAYCDLAAPRWQKLRPYLAHKTPRAGRGLPWRRVVTYAGAVALMTLLAVFVVGPAAERSRDSQSPGVMSAVKSGPETEYGRQVNDAGTVATAGSITAPAAAVAAAAKTVVVIRAGAQEGMWQAVKVLRVLKGVKPVAGRLTVPATGALTPGKRYIVYLPGPALPRAEGGGTDLPSAAVGNADGDTAQPGYTPSPGSPDPFALGGDLSLVLRWSGLPVFVEPVPAGTALDAISLP